MPDIALCLFDGCNYPEGECSGECLTPRIGFGRPRLVVDCSHLTSLPTISELAAQLHAVPGRLEPGRVVAMPVDVAHPDPAPGDPWPRHLCMPGIEWPAPLTDDLLSLVSGFGFLGASPVVDHVDYVARLPRPDAEPLAPPAKPHGDGLPITFALGLVGAVGCVVFLLAHAYRLLTA